MTQAANRKTVKKKKLATTSFTSPQSDLERLISAQRDSSSPVRSVVVSGDLYIAFLYTGKQLKDIELFCCDPNDNNSCVLDIDTTFKLCNMWITDISYRNKRLLSSRARKNPVHIGPVVMSFTKDEGTFRRFCVELISANPQLINLKKDGVDMEAAIFSGFHSVISKLLQLYCSRHLQQRDEKAIDSCHQKSSTADNNKTSYKKEIIWDIYWKRTSGILEKDTADATDSDDFHAKLFSLELQWEKLCRRVYNWFLTHRKKKFLQSVIESAREGTNVVGLLYQNDIDSSHATEKRIQCFKMGSVLEEVNTIKILIERKENEEVLVLYGGGRYVLSQEYKNWYGPIWQSWIQKGGATH